MQCGWPPSGIPGPFCWTKGGCCNLDNSDPDVPSKKGEIGGFHQQKTRSYTIDPRKSQVSPFKNVCFPLPPFSDVSCATCPVSRRVFRAPRPASRCYRWIWWFPPDRCVEAVVPQRPEEWRMWGIILHHSNWDLTIKHGGIQGYNGILRRYNLRI